VLYIREALAVFPVVWAVCWKRILALVSKRQQEMVQQPQRRAFPTIVLPKNNRERRKLKPFERPILCSGASCCERPVTGEGE
jgi:hypothetical protein